MTGPVARLSGIVRTFGSVTALDGADLELHAGEVHGVLGENGAGKTTLLSVLGGMLRPDAGRVEVDGREIVLATPRDAWAHGIGLVHQHFTLVPAMTVLENLALGRRGSAGGLTLRFADLRRAASEASSATGLSVPLDSRVEDLGVGDRQRVEILKALLRSPRILVLDEPTAVLTPGETRTLFELLRTLAGGGCSVVLVAHKLDEVLSVADRVTVLRAGRTVASAPVADVDTSSLIRAMVGGNPVHLRGAPERRPARTRSAEALARLDDVFVRNLDGSWALRGVTLAVEPGEIVGIAGVEGNGQHALAMVLSGRMLPDRGSAVLPPGVGFIPQDRSTEGLIPDFDLAENVGLGLLDEPSVRWGPFLRWGSIRDRAEAVRSKYGVRAPDVHTPARALSGGNQQRVVVGRELSKASDLLVAENPTRGLDVGATAFVHGELRSLAAGHRAPGAVLISTDLDEILALSDRIFTIVRGRLFRVPESARSREDIGRLMLRGTGEEA